MEEKVSTQRRCHLSWGLRAHGSWCQKKVPTQAVVRKAPECLGDKEQLSEAEAVVGGCAESNLFVYLLKRKQSPIWTVAFFINQNQSLLMHEGPSMLHRALFSAF